MEEWEVGKSEGGVKSERGLFQRQGKACKRQKLKKLMYAMD